LKALLISLSNSQYKSEASQKGLKGTLIWILVYLCT